MSYSVWGEELFTAHFSGSPVFAQRFKMPSRSYVMAAVRSSVHVLNDPAFTSLEMRIYSDNAGTLGDLLFTSAPVLKATILTAANGIREVPFAFNPKPMLKGGDYYFLVLWANGYSGDENSHIAWVLDWPNPQNPTGYTPTLEALNTAPFAYAFMGAPV